MARQKWKEWSENQDNLAVMSAWARAGLTDEEIAKRIGIRRSTLVDWKKKYDSIRTALAPGKDFSNRMVENSLFRTTQGYEVKVKKAFKLKKIEYDENGRKKTENEVLEYAEETVYVEPEIKAVMFWLENRMPEWRKRYEKAGIPDADDETRAGTVVMGADIAEDIKQLMEEEKNAREEKERREGLEWREDRYGGSKGVHPNP